MLWFWALVVGAMACVGLLAVLADPTEPHRSHPPVRELFDDAVDVRHTVALSLRTGDVEALQSHLAALSERWAPDGAPDHRAARAAAVATLERMGDAASVAPRDAAWRDRLVTEADLFAALAADPEDPTLVALAAGGFEVADVRPTGGELPAFDDAETRLAEAVARSGHTTLDELRSRLAERGAPTLPPRDTPTLDPPSVEDLPR